jgi:hypothetical protein
VGESGEGKTSGGRKEDREESITSLREKAHRGHTTCGDGEIISSHSGKPGKATIVIELPPRDAVGIPRN